MAMGTRKQQERQEDLWIAAAERLEEVGKEAAADERMNAQGLEEVVADKGYHSGARLVDLRAIGVRSYIPEPKRKHRHWQGKAGARADGYANRPCIRGERGKQLLRRRGERVERSFAHIYDTGGMRTTHLRGHRNILKRLLIHVAAFNLSLILRQQLGKGTPRSLQGLRNRFCFRFWVVWMLLGSLGERQIRQQIAFADRFSFLPVPDQMLCAT